MKMRAPTAFCVSTFSVSPTTPDIGSQWMRLNGSRFGSIPPNLPDVPLPIVPPLWEGNAMFQRKAWVADASGAERFLDDSADLLLNFPAKRSFHAMASEACVQDPCVQDTSMLTQGRRT